MTERFEISRRKALTALGTIGVASAGAGLGTSAYFNDTESFEDNSLTAGSLDLFVDYWTSTDQGSYGSSASSGTMDGATDVTYDYALSDVKPGDSGALAFCPKIVDNPAWLWLGSSGVVDYENGQTEPEADADGSAGGTIGTSNDGAPHGELSESIQVTVSYADGVSPVTNGAGDLVGFDCVNPVELNNPEDYTLADLSDDLLLGFLMDVGRSEAGPQPYPGSPDNSTQTGPCLCIEWEVPIEVGNEIQTDAIEFDFTFEAEQSRHNGSPMSPFVDTVLRTDPDPSGNYFLTAYVKAAPTTVVRVELDDSVYSGFPQNPNAYQLEVNIDSDDDGLGESLDDDFRFGYGGSASSPPPGPDAGGYLRRRTSGGSFVDLDGADVSGFSATESADQRTYQFVIDWDAVAADPDVPELSSAPSKIVINEVFATDGGGLSGSGIPSSQLIVNESGELTL